MQWRQKKVFPVAILGLFCTFQKPKTKRWRLALYQSVMKKKLHHILISFCVALTAVTTTSFAQDSGSSDYEITDPERDKLERDRIINSPGEGDTRYIPRPQGISNTTARDSAASKTSTPVAPSRLKPEPVKPADKQAPPKQDDDSILSFNFLYYIIQKYKLQDIID
jgi:hypothetical protein